MNMKATVTFTVIENHHNCSHSPLTITVMYEKLSVNIPAMILMYDPWFCYCTVQKK